MKDELPPKRFHRKLALSGASAWRRALFAYKDTNNRTQVRRAAYTALREGREAPPGAQGGCIYVSESEPMRRLEMQQCGAQGIVWPLVRD